MSVFMLMCYVFKRDSHLTIIQLERQLRSCVEKMSKEKQERLKVMKSRMKVDQHLCDLLNAIPYYIPTGCVPSHQQLTELEQHIRDLEAEQVVDFYRGTVVVVMSILLSFHQVLQVMHAHV